MQGNVAAFGSWALVETHVHKGSEIRRWDKEVRAPLKLRMDMNSARRTSKAVSSAKEAVANEGGDAFFFRQHLQIQQLTEARAAAKYLKAPKQAAYDGFCPMMLQQQSYTIATVALCAHPSINMTGKTSSASTKINES